MEQENLKLEPMPTLEKSKKEKKAEKVKKDKPSKSKKEDKPSTKKKVKKEKPSTKKSAKKEDATKEDATKDNRDIAIEAFDALLVTIEDEVALVKADKKHVVGVKFLRNVARLVKQIKTKSMKVMRKKRVVRTNGNSGFLKTVTLSDEMLAFTGWSKEDQKSRVDVTKFICKYINDNKLQNPKDRREIVADAKLRKLLRYTPGKDPQLTYFRLQTHMKPHFL